MNQLQDPHAVALKRFLEGVPDVDWALTGSTSFALQGVPVEPNDVDVQTDEAGVRAIENAFVDHVIDPVQYVESERIRSYLGALELAGVEVEIFGDLRTRDGDAEWKAPVDVTDHREYVAWRGYEVPVLSLDYEAAAYERLGRGERAALLREHALE